MAKPLLSQSAFGKAVVSRARRERPEIRVQTMGKDLLLIQSESGQRRVVSLATLYQAYRDAPQARHDDVVGDFLVTEVYQEPVDITGTFAENRHKIMPQVVPATLLEFCRKDRRELASLPFLGDLGIAFVADEDERYTYIHKRVVADWGVDELDLLRAAMDNLQGLAESGATYYRLGLGARTMLVWETFDGYDASRVLLTRGLIEAASLLAGNPIIGLPHRDYLVMFGDADPEFVLQMQERIREEFEAHPYPITARFLTLVGGNLVPYAGEQERLVN